MAEMVQQKHKGAQITQDTWRQDWLLWACFYLYKKTIRRQNIVYLYNVFVEEAKKSKTAPNLSLAYLLAEQKIFKVQKAPEWTFVF